VRAREHADHGGINAARQLAADFHVAQELGLDAAAQQFFELIHRLGVADLAPLANRAVANTPASTRRQA
jgi:hypothetical protein